MICSVAKFHKLMKRKEVDLGTASSRHERKEKHIQSKLLLYKQSSSPMVYGPMVYNLGAALNHIMNPVQNTANGVQRTTVRKQQNTQRKLRHTIRRRRNQTN